MEAIRNDTTKTLTAADILSMAGVKRPSEMENLTELLKTYPSNTGVIRYRDGSGKVKDWFSGAAVK